MSYGIIAHTNPRIALRVPASADRLPRSEQEVELIGKRQWIEQSIATKQSSQLVSLTPAVQLFAEVAALRIILNEMHIDNFTQQGYLKAAVWNRLGVTLTLLGFVPQPFPLPEEGADE